MKSIIFTILAIITLATFAKASTFTPLDTISKKNKPCVFDLSLSQNVTPKAVNATVTELFTEEPSRQTAVNLKPLNANFSGYKVEVAKVNYKPLEETASVFSIYDTLTLERMGTNVYAYLVGNFKNKKEAEAFLQDMDSNDALTIVHYKNGKRIN